MNVKIVADSTCDLSADLIEKYDITIIPLCIVMGENSYFDGIETTPEEIGRPDLQPCGKCVRCAAPNTPLPAGDVRTSPAGFFAARTARTERA